MPPKLDLRFPPSGANTGFTSVSTASFADLRPTAVVRELVQNSLDAARGRQAIVRFRTAREKTKAIPGIRAYESAFRAAIKHQRKLTGGTLSDQAQMVVDTIEGALAQREQDILFVSDNGIGLNKARMTALVADGISLQEGSGATGSYGNGHSVPIPASDLRYVLYGGVTESGHRISSGLAVLASHHLSKGSLNSGHGLLTLSGKRDLAVGKHDFARGSNVPAILAPELRRIQKEDRHGAVVALLSFNNFRKDESLWSMVSKAVACNFFAAIHDRVLVVRVEEQSPEGKTRVRKLRAENLHRVLEEHGEEKRSRSFLSGSRALQAYSALSGGVAHEVQTEQGTVQVCLRMDTSGTTRIHLCRNGMWITSSPPGFQNHFTSRRPFQALILVDAKTGGEFHNLVRKAEGPLHDSLTLRRLLPDDRRALREALGQVRDFLKTEVPEVGAESFRADDFLALDFGEDRDGGGGASGRPSFWGTPMAAGGLALPGWKRSEQESGSNIRQLRASTRQGAPTRPGLRSGRARRRPALRSIIRAVSAPSAPERHRIDVQCAEACEDAEVRLVVDENLDATCESRRGDMPPVGLTGVRIDGRLADAEKLVTENGQVVAVRLGDLKEGAAVQLDVGYALPSGLEGLDDSRVAFRVEMHQAVRESEQRDSA